MVPIDPQILVQLEAAVERCGIPRTEVEIGYEDELQSEAIRVSSAELSDEQIVCLQKAQFSPPFPIITFGNSAVSARDFELQQIESRKLARAWLEERRMLHNLPTFDPAQEKPQTFARRLESFCGIEPGTALDFDDQLGLITPKIGWIGQPLRRGWLWRKLHGKRHDRQFECLVNVMSATETDELGIKFGFVGNQAFSDEPKP